MEASPNGLMRVSAATWITTASLTTTELQHFQPPFPGKPWAYPSTIEKSTIKDNSMKKILIFLVSAFLLHGCGGGSDDSGGANHESNPTPTPPSTPDDRGFGAVSLNGSLWENFYACPSPGFTDTGNSMSITWGGAGSCINPYAPNHILQLKILFDSNSIGSGSRKPTSVYAVYVIPSRIGNSIQYSEIKYCANISINQCNFFSVTGPGSISIDEKERSISFSNLNISMASYIVNDPLVSRINKSWMTIMSGVLRY
jgi:hypothetical protein